LTPAEAAAVAAAPDPSVAFLSLWVRKESLVKMGLIDLDGLSSVDLTAARSSTVQGLRRGRLGPVHLLDWVDERRRAVVGAAGGHRLIPL
jgi:4'-phosphopantetheinyl transferase